MKKEYPLIFAVGFIVLAYILDAVTKPLSLSLTTPYHYFTPSIISLYPFTTVSIVLKAIALIITPPLLLSRFGLRKLTTGIILFILSVLVQLYALQDIVSRSYAVPLEWSLALALAGAVLLIPTLFFILLGLFEKPKTAETKRV